MEPHVLASWEPLGVSAVVLFCMGAAIIALGFSVFSHRAPDGRSATALLWFVVFGLTALALSCPSQDVGERCGVVEPLALWIATISLALTSFITAEGVMEHRRAWRGIRSSPMQLVESPRKWAGFDESCTALGLLILLGVVGELSLSMKTVWGTHRIVSLLLGASAFVSGIALLRLVTRRWSIGLADVGASLLTVGFATLLLVVLPATSQPLSDHLPARFNTILVGLTVMIGFWAWLYRVWEQQLDGGVAWTTAGRLRSRIPRLIVGITVISLVVAGMMAVWPRLPLIGCSDASFLRIGFGTAGHLFLILVLTIIARKWRHAPLGVLSGLGVLSLCVFLVIRLSMFSSIET
ncbi:MAG: hypothetical protein GXP29_06675 [Planctomycetes bacterium]|nr:hypothetical protein [Planctomycetota bacterium]